MFELGPRANHIEIQMISVSGRQNKSQVQSQRAKGKSASAAEGN